MAKPPSVPAKTAQPARTAKPATSRKAGSPGKDAAARKTATPTTAAPTGPTALAGRPSLASAAVVLAALTVAAVGLHLLSAIVAPAFFALTLMITARPLQRQLVRWRVPKMLAAVAVLLVMYVLLLILLVATAGALAQAALELPKYSGAFQQMYTDLIDWLATLGVEETALTGLIESVDLNRVASIAGTVLESMSSAGGQFVIIVVVMFFLAIDTTAVSSRWTLITGARPELGISLRTFFTGVRKYWLVCTVFGLIVAVLDVIALIIIGVPLALVLGLLAFVTNYIPNVGFVIGLVPAALLALLDGGMSDMLWVIVIYSVLNFTIQTIVQPKVTGDAVGLSPVVSFLSLTLWTLVVGPLGAILAVPLTLAAKAFLVDAHPEARWINAFLVTDPDAKKFLRSTRKRPERKKPPVAPPPPEQAAAD